MRLWSDAINSRGLFDARYTCDLDNSSPELRWEDPPPGTAAFALLAVDIDVHPDPFVHWLVYRIPPDLKHLPTGIPPQEQLPNGIRQGLNSFGKLGYSGPCPPRGANAHRYTFRLMALREAIDLEPRLKLPALTTRLDGLVLEAAEIHGLYQRQIERTG